VWGHDLPITYVENDNAWLGYIFIWVCHMDIKRLVCKILGPYCSWYNVAFHCFTSFRTEYSILSCNEATYEVRGRVDENIVQIPNSETHFRDFFKFLLEINFCFTFFVTLEARGFHLVLWALQCLNSHNLHT